MSYPIIDRIFGDEYFQESNEANQFRSEHEMRKIRQDEGLDVISQGLDSLKNLARDMNEVHNLKHTCCITNLAR